MRVILVNDGWVDQPLTCAALSVNIHFSRPRGRVNASSESRPPAVAEWIGFNAAKRLSNSHGHIETVIIMMMETTISE